MNVLPFFAVVLCGVSVNGGYLPEFHDDVHGRMIVSLENPPFLTLKAHPERAFYLPTERQVAAIREAVFSGNNRFRRSDYSNENGTSDVVKMRLKRDIRDGQKIGDSELTLSPDDFTEGMETFELYSKFVGRMIVSMFKGIQKYIPTGEPV
jgi:hypothetical protein